MVHVIFNEAPALQVADMADTVLLLSVALDLLIVPVAATDPMAPLEVDFTIVLPDDLPISQILALLYSLTARLAVSLLVAVLASMLPELAMAPAISLSTAVLEIFIEPDALKLRLVEALGTLLQIDQLVA